MSVIEKVDSFLKLVAEGENISNYEVIPDKDVLNGDGFLSEFYTGEIRNKDTGKLIQVYIKVPPPHTHDLDINDDVYVNEFNYYSNIYPKLNKFQTEKGVREPFDKIPRFYRGSLEQEKQFLVLENLKVQNYVLHDKAKFIDETHLKSIFKTYGKYHALTFAFKEQEREKHEEMIKPLTNVVYKILETEHVQANIKAILEIAHAALKEIDQEKSEKIKPLFENIRETVTRGITYKGKYSALVHGDCWSNNIMFKYNANGELENIKLLDHQLLGDSSPVHDLSYFFYSGASKKDFDKLDEYLELYYEHFSSFARELGSDPEKLLPFEALKSDWKEYSFLGINMSLLVWQVKLVAKKKLQDCKDELRNSFADVLTSDTFKNNICDILLHAIEYNII